MNEYFYNQLGDDGSSVGVAIANDNDVLGSEVPFLASDNSSDPQSNSGNTTLVVGGILLFLFWWL